MSKLKPMKEYKTQHYKKRQVERGFVDKGYIWVLGHFIVEYGYKETHNSIPRRLKNKNRRAFLVPGSGVKGDLILIDASGDVVALPTGITTPLDHWGPLPESERQYYSVSKRKNSKN
ncbi:hypothetical protein AYK24_00115 [Thermoplasmatales archaeon SG8-52-4]|nr:MAG: hypothetical protein AYK24_00115 [Thermoplasmatales archaeon SG8-52-4]